MTRRGLRSATAAKARRGSERGYILIIFLVVLTLMMIALSAAVPRLAQQIQREREIEMVHRGEQYARAIKRYYKKFGRYPARIEDLENTNTLRFLRKRYKDPITGGPWRLVRYGEIQLSQGSGIGTPAQLLGQTNNSQAAAQSGLFNMNFGGSSGQQNQATAAAVANAAAGSTTGTGTTTGVAGSTTGTSVTTGVAGSTTTTDAAPTSGTTESSGQSSFGQSSNQTTSSSGSLFSSPASSAQPGGGGGAIMGVASLSKKSGIHEFNKKAAYKDWLFIYDPAQDRGQLLRGPYNPQAFVGQVNTNVAGTSPAAGTSGTMNSSGASGTGMTLGTSSSSSSSTPSTSTGSSSTGQSSGSIVPSTQ